MVKSGVLRASADGDLEIVYDAFLKPGLYSERKERERLPKDVERAATERATTAPKKAAPKAFAENTTPLIDMKHQEVQASIGPITLMDTATLRARSFNQRQIAKQAYREEAGFRKWKEQEQKREREEAEMEAFANWLDFQGDPREIWDDKDAWGYQDYLEFLKPKAQPKPELGPVGDSSAGDDGSLW